MSKPKILIQMKVNSGHVKDYGSTMLYRRYLLWIMFTVLLMIAALACSCIKAAWYVPPALVVATLISYVILCVAVQKVRNQIWRVVQTMKEPVDLDAVVEQMKENRHKT